MIIGMECGAMRMVDEVSHVDSVFASMSPEEREVAENAIRPFPDEEQGASQA